MPRDSPGPPSVCWADQTDKLEERLHLGGEATLILSNGDIDGRIVAFQGDVHSGYEITIETKKSGCMTTSKPLRAASYHS